jgi:hypothetical protein
MHPWILTLFFFSAAPGLCWAEEKPPPAPVHEVQDDYFGTKISDPYRWQFGKPEFQPETSKISKGRWESNVS